ncbi:SDR family oxidoreductase [Sulfobacillus thermosulfidooxidans]|uniref:SDR family oxidoreductase n=1 Tax=Sulfobacillus thermosulfidooxidans TaxID=28034 RepID=UPI0006B68F8A|nr:SDR family oxidoreductase [Sulfobacillus thermosulfidooxidans]
MGQEFESDRAIVTGGSRGIGWSVAEELVAQGARVLLVARQHDALKARVDELNRRFPAQAFFYACDMGNQPACAQAVVQYALNTIGQPTLLLNGAGGASITSALDAPWSLWVDDFQVKFFGYLAMTRAVLPVMMQQRKGVVVNLVGIAGKDPNRNLPIASAINGALNGVMKVLADDVSAYGVRIINVNPGATETDLLDTMAQATAQRSGDSVENVLKAMRARAPLGRLPSAADIAGVILFLMSRRAAFITGTSIDVDGGIHRGAF